MNTETNIHQHLDQYEEHDIKQRAIDYLSILLHHISVSQAARELRTYIPTLHRIINPDLPMESIGYITCAYIVFMCETNERIIRILNSPPKGAAYYKRNQLA